MNSKKVLVIGFTSVYLLVITQIVLGQSLRYNSSNFYLNLPSLSDINPSQHYPTPFYTYLLEYGNGRYFKSTNHVHDEYANNPLVINYADAIPASSNAVLTVVGHYDTTPPPMRMLVASNISNPGGYMLTSQDSLHGNKIGLNYSDQTIVPGDTMTVVVTYKPDLTSRLGGNVSGDYIVAFFYNDTVKGGKIFSEINNPEKQFQFNGVDIPVVRRHNQENPYTSISSVPHAGIPDQVFSTLNTTKGSCKSALYFIIPHNANINEKNIFLSLAPELNNGSNYTFDVAGLRAVIIKYSATAIINQQTVRDSLPINFYSRDPNGISTSPACITSAHDDVKAPWDTKIRYMVSFVNEGEGKAGKIEATVTIPEGFQFPPQNFKPSLNIKGRPVVLFNQQLIPDNFQRSSGYTYTILPGRKIFFSMPGINLPGTVLNKDIKGRTGLITFNLTTLHSPAQIPSCMFSYISIVFYNNTNDKRGNPPVNKWNLLTRDCGYNCPLSQYHPTNPGR